MFLWRNLLLCKTFQSLRIISTIKSRWIYCLREWKLILKLQKLGVHRTNNLDTSCLNLHHRKNRGNRKYQVTTFLLLRNMLLSLIFNTSRMFLTMLFSEEIVSKMHTLSSLLTIWLSIVFWIKKEMQRWDCKSLLPTILVGYLRWELFIRFLSVILLIKNQKYQKGFNLKTI